MKALEAADTANVSVMEAAALCCNTPCAPAQTDLSEAELASCNQIAELCKALAHPARVQILLKVARVSGCIGGDLVEELGLAQSTVSQHLKVLKESGLIQGTLSGPATCYCINPDTIRRLRVLIAGL